MSEKELISKTQSFLDRLINASTNGTIHPELFEADADTLRELIDTLKRASRQAAAQAYEREVREVCAAICKGRQAGREIGSGEWLEAEKCATTILDDSTFDRIRALKDKP
jgi:gamma-glutamylcyclotransferase (GGCT)/AIG2-like uncharacterized protein YtfP